MHTSMCKLLLFKEIPRLSFFDFAITFETALFSSFFFIKLASPKLAFNGRIILVVLHALGF